MTTPLPTQKPWFLVGLPGTGKTRVGRELAKLFGVPHVDTDREIERNTQSSIPELFEKRGEAAFRTLETEALRKALSRPAIVSLGGGAIESEANRRFLRDQTVIWIDAEHAELVRRVSRNDRRPLLRQDPEGTLAALRAKRETGFKEVATLRVSSSSEPLTEVVRQILQATLGWDVVWVRGMSQYPVVTGPGVSTLLVGQVPAKATKAFVVSPESLAFLAQRVVHDLQSAGLQVSTFTHVDGEGAKELSTAAKGWDAMAEAGIGRKDVVVSVGGGVTTDLAGFLAATWLRGVGVIHVPTSLLAMVDASIGGKTGINTLAGKNLVGSFYDPLAVLIDLDFLSTLPEPEFVAGLAEVVKTGLIEDARILDLVTENPQVGDRDWATAEGKTVTTELVRRSVAVKARVVTEDRLEGGLREILNYGHTMGHAIERAENFTLRHGEAVAIGSVFAAHLAERLGLVEREFVDLQEMLFKKVGLPTTYSGDLQTLMEGIRSDKKVRSSQLRFVLLHGQGQPKVVPVSPAVVREVALQLGLGEATNE